MQLFVGPNIGEVKKQRLLKELIQFHLLSFQYGLGLGEVLYYH